MRGVIRSRFWKRVSSVVLVVAMVVSIIGFVTPTQTATATVVTFSTGSATVLSWEAPAGVTSVDVECWGAGGGGADGGSTAAGNTGGGGGGGGAYASSSNVAVTPGVFYDYWVGLGGIGGTTDEGGDGASSTFNGTSCNAGPGYGGRADSNGGAGGLTASSSGDGSFAGGTGGAGGGSAQAGGGGGSSASSTAVGLTGNDFVTTTGGAATASNPPEFGGGGKGGDYSNNSPVGSVGVVPGGGGGGGSERQGGATGEEGYDGADGQVRLTYTADTTAPTPDPMTFATVPFATTTAAIEMVSTTGTDDNTVQYYFTSGSTGCIGGNEGTGDEDSSWQTSTTYYDSGLQVNKCYSYEVTARDIAGNYGATSTASAVYTHANVPGGMDYSSVGVTSLTLMNNENGNPSSGPWTTFLVYATSSDANWNGFYITAAGATSSSEVWILDSDIDNAVLAGLQTGTLYDFQAVAQNQDGIRTATSTLTGTTTVSDAFAPTPDAATFSSVPNDTSISTIDMTATTGSDDTPPIDYYFTSDNSTCGVDAGTGGTNSTWQTSDATYTDSVLQTNQCYGYTITMRDSLGNYGATSTISAVYTEAAPAGTPALGNASDATLDITSDINGNPATTTFLMFVASSTPADATWEGKYVDASGDPSATEVWLTDAVWDTVTLTDLNFITTYSLEAVSRNGNNEKTATSSQGDGLTLQDQTAPVDDAIFSTSPNNFDADRIDMISSVVTDPSGPVEYYFTEAVGSCGANNGTGGTDSAWQTGTSYSDSTLDPNKCYSYTVTARDAFGNSSGTSTASSTYTSANVPGVLTFANVSSSTFDITNDANSNPTADPITTYAVYATSTDATWNNKYVDSAGDPSAAVVWLNNAQVINLTVRGMVELTLYDFEVVARNADLDITASSTLAGTTTIDLTGPTPDPLTFIDPSGLPDNDADGQISIQSNTATDPTPTINYSFFATSSSCTAGHFGTGGTNSGWQIGTSYIDASLQANKCYGYQILARDGDGNQNGTSTASSTYTSANVPGTPTFSAPSETTLTITNTENSNPSVNPTTEFLVYIASSTPNDAGKVGQYASTTGGSQVSEAWMTDAEIDSLVVTGLTGNTIYSFEVVARNVDGDRTATSSQGDGSTGDDSAPTPDPMVFLTTPNNTSSTTVNMISVTGADLSTVNYYFTASTGSCGADNGTGGDDSTWQSGTTYNDSGLQTNKCYGYLVTARDSVGNYGATSTASSTYTSANIPGVLTFSNLSSSTVDLTNDANGNPTSNPATLFAIFATSTDATWDQKYVNASGDPSASPVWHTDGDINTLTVRGMDELVMYDFEVVAQNASLDVTSSSTLAGTTTIDLTAPTPNPMTFVTSPNNTATDTINMISTTGTDISNPIEYYFTAVTGSCGGDIGTGGTNSSWQSSETYNDGGLQSNQCYGYQVTSRDSSAMGANYGATSSASVAYTSASAPGLPSAIESSPTTMNLSNDENSNPSSNPVTVFAIQIVGSSPSDTNWNSQYVDTDGTPSAGAVWMSDATIEALSTTGMATETAYTIHVKARNNDGDETGFGSSSILSTSPPPRPTILRLNGLRLNGARLY